MKFNVFCFDYIFFFRRLGLRTLQTRYRYTVMSGTPQKMLEHLLETRLGGQVGPNDPFLDDFILTHIVFMPVQILINELANLYPFSNATKKNMLSFTNFMLFLLY